jgi:hypothetical membrane protein
MPREGSTVIHALPVKARASDMAADAAATRVRVGGTLLFLAGTIILLGIISAEALYPGSYSTGANEISDLGGTRPPEGLVLQPSATIFDVSMMVVGLLTMAASWLVHRGVARRSVTIPIAVLGLAALGVGVFPGNTGTPHAVCSLVTFVAGGIAAITSALVTRAPLRYASIALGAISLVTLASYAVLDAASPWAVLGTGGVERWIVYPIVLWIVGFGGYLAAAGDR